MAMAMMLYGDEGTTYWKGSGDDKFLGMLVTLRGGSGAIGFMEEQIMTFHGGF